MKALKSFLVMATAMLTVLALAPGASAEKSGQPPTDNSAARLVTNLVGGVVGALGSSLGPAAAPKLLKKATLSPITGSGKSATATFTPAASGQKAALQLMTIKTSETDETKTPAWKTIATGKQSSSGRVTFSISDPREVAHQYRAISGVKSGQYAISNSVTFAAALPSKATGLSQVYFNSYEGDSVNTRTRYFEGEFSMTGSGKAGCGAVARTPKTTMKGRGNYSWGFAKKSFTLKLKDGLDLCGLGKSKKWALVANHYDKSLMRNTVAGHVGQVLTKLAWTPKSKPVDLYVNGSYRGSYILIERITIDEDRVNIPELKDDGQQTNASHPNNVSPGVTGGYLLEWDFRAADGGSSAPDNYLSAGPRGYVGIKDPENSGGTDGISKQQKAYINSYVDATDAALFGGNFTSDSSGWKKYIDQASAVDYYIGMELMKPVDGNMWASVYMYKQRNGKLFFGPLWDFDLSSGSANRAGNTVSPTGWYLKNSLRVSAMQSSKTWFNRLNEDPDFRNAVRARWKQVYPKLDQSSYLSGQKSLIQKSADENFTKWSVTEHLSAAQVVKGSFSKEVSYLSSWMSSRRSWMNSQLK